MPRRPSTHIAGDAATREARAPAPSPREHQEELQRLRELLDRSNDAIFLFELGSGRLVEVNRTAARLLSCPAEELVGAATCNEILAAPLARRIHEARAPGDLETTQITSLHGRRGTVIPAELTLGFLRSGSKAYAVVVAREISDRLRQEHEHARLYRQAQELNRLRDEFLGVLSHELRTPLTSILGWSELLESNRVPPEDRQRAAAAIARNAQAQAQIIDDLLDVSRMITGRVQLEVRLVDLAEVVRAAEASVRLAAEAKRIRLQLDELPHMQLRGDELRLQQIVWNLLSNAIKFTPPGGLVQVSLEEHHGCACIIVRDTGKGFDPSFKPYLFERFRLEDASSTRAEGGLGLGLAIVRHLVELHGGLVTAESRGVGEGASFTVILPMTPQPGSEDDAADAAAAETGDEAMPAEAGTEERR